MAMDRLSLARFLELLQLPQARRLKLIERDARKAAYEERGGEVSEGGDFYGPFWADAKRSVVDDEFCLNSAIKERVKRNKSRQRLYPLLQKGFEHGWETLRSSYIGAATLNLVSQLSATVKGSEESDHLRVTNVLAVKEPDSSLHIMYPYFSKDIRLGVRHANFGVDVLKESFARAKPRTVAMLDVLRGSVFIASGEEAESSAREILINRYDAVMREWRAQKRFYSR